MTWQVIENCSKMAEKSFHSGFHARDERCRSQVRQPCGPQSQMLGFIRPLTLGPSPDTLLSIRPFLGTGHCSDGTQRRGRKAEHTRLATIAALARCGLALLRCHVGDRHRRIRATVIIAWAERSCKVIEKGQINIEHKNKSVISAAVG